MSLLEVTADVYYNLPDLRELIAPLFLKTIS